MRSNICFESAGRARLKDASGNHLFSFESTLNDHIWRVLVDVPFKGQEEIIIQIPPAQLIDTKLEIKGSVASKLVSLLGRDRGLKNSFEVFVRLMLQISKKESLLICDKDNNIGQEKCRIGPIAFNSKLDGNQIFLNNFSNSKTNLDLQLVMTKGDQGLEKLFVTMRNGTPFSTELNMFLSHCVVRK